MSFFNELQGQMIKYRFRPDAKLSQNFVIDERLVSKMAECACLSKKDTVLEIGCGTGFLTRELLKHSKVVGFETDHVLCGLLTEDFGSGKSFRLFGQNFIAAEPKEIAALKFSKVVSLPPYSISSEIMLKLFEAGFETAVLVFQREFSEKIIAEPGFYEYGYLAALGGMFYDSEIVIRNISPMSFYPKPDAYSSLLVMKRRKNALEEKNVGSLIFFVKNIFRFKNKNLSNALRNCLKELERAGFNGKKIAAAISSTGLGNSKVNLLEPEEILGFFKKIKK